MDFCDKPFCGKSEQNNFEGFRKYSYSKVGPLSLAFVLLVLMFAERPLFWNKDYGAPSAVIV